MQNEQGGMCEKIRDQYDLAIKNWYIKYGDLGMHHRVEHAFMKQGPAVSVVECQNPLPNLVSNMKFRG